MMQEYRNIEFPTQIIQAQQEADTRWTCLALGIYFTLTNTDFIAIYELNV